jgi:hypothetical protein
MTQGILIFAFNNDQLDYLSMANWSAQNIRRHLGLPVCVVTDCENIPAHYNFDHVVMATAREPSMRHFGDVDQIVTWYNGNRVDAYDVSPWDHTLVLDADYVVASDQLKVLFSYSEDFLAHRRAYDVTGLQPFDDLNRFGRYHMPMWWATVMLFRRSTGAKLMFDSMKMIRANWSHYRQIYQNPRSTYRNDHALSIALGMIDGHLVNHAEIPWDLASLTSGYTLEHIDQDCYKVNFINSQNQLKWVRIKNQDFHAMGKRHLGNLIANSK